MKKGTIVLLLCLILLVSCSSPAIIPEPSTEQLTPIGEPIPEEASSYMGEPEIEESTFLPDFPWDEIGWTESRAGCEEDGAIGDLSNWHPHPSVVGLPEEVPSRGWPTNPEQVRYLSSTSVDCRDIGGGIYLVGFDDTFVYEDDRGLVGLKNPTYQQLVDFLAVDETDKQEFKIKYWIWSEEEPGKKEYITETEVEELKAQGCGDYYNEFVFICTDFALMLRENANNAGWRCACVGLGFQLHTINAFETSDKGLVWYNPQCDDPSHFGRPVCSRYDPWFFPFGYEPENQKDEPWEGIIVYIW